MKRRTFITLLGGAAAWSREAQAQQPSLPVVGFLRGSTAQGSEHLVSAVRKGLSETGHVEGRDFAFEHRWADGHPERLPALAADLVRQRVSVIVASASTAAIAARGATSTIPIVFVTTIDPIKAGLIVSFNRPGGNATGFAYLTSVLGAKRLEFLQQLVPSAKTVAVLVHPRQPSTEPFLRDLKGGAAALGLRLAVMSVTNDNEIDSAFLALAKEQPDALVLGADPLITSRSDKIIALAARYRFPAIYTTGDWARAGGLMAWGVNLVDQYRLAGTYVGKILKGSKPADMPVQTPTKYELVINLKTARALGLEVPHKLLALADEVVE